MWEEKESRGGAHRGERWVGGVVRTRVGRGETLAAVPGCELKCIFFFLLSLYLPFERNVVGWITNPELPPARSSLSST